jgi:hypothetical protein
VGYSIYGTSLDIHKPISSVIEQDAWSVVVNAGLFLHCIIAYQININVGRAASAAMRACTIASCPAVPNRCPAPPSSPKAVS